MADTHFSGVELRAVDVFLGHLIDEFEKIAIPGVGHDKV
jgi:hypothetical protein